MGTLLPKLPLAHGICKGDQKGCRVKKEKSRKGSGRSPALPFPPGLHPYKLHLPSPEPFLFFLQGPVVAEAAETEGTGCAACSSQEDRELKSLPPSEQDSWTSCHTSHTAPVPEPLHSLLPHPEVQVTFSFSLALYYCQRELCLYITG